MKSTRRLAMILGASIGFLALAAVHAADAATITIGAREDAAAPVVVAGPNVGAASTPSGGVLVGADYRIEAGGVGQPFLPNPGVLASNNIAVSSLGSAAHTLDVFVTAQGNNIPGLQAYVSSFTLNTVFGNAAVTMSTYLDTANGLFTISGGTVTQLGLAGPGNVPFVETDVTNANCGANCSVTALYHIATTGATLTNATINVSAVPGPIVGAGLPGLLFACGGLIALARRRRKATA